MGKKRRSKTFQRPTTEGYNFIRKDSEWLESPAYRDLSVLARCLFEEFLIIYRPDRNGKLSISIRRAAERLKVSENTACNAFGELVEHGFIKLELFEHWQQRRAREWTLTIFPIGGKEPTDDWREWMPNKPVRLAPKKNLRSQKSRSVASNIEADKSQNLRQDPMDEIFRDITSMINQ